MRRSSRPIVKLVFVITLSGLLSACLDDEPQAYFNRVIFQNQQQCSTYLTNVECSKFFEKIRQDLEQNRLTKFRTYNNREDCIKVNNNCEVRQYNDYTNQVVWIANPHYYVAELDKDYNDKNNYKEDMQVVDYNIIYGDPQNNNSTSVSNSSTNHSSSGSSPNFLGFYYFGYMNNGHYQSGSGYNNYYKQSITPRSGSYATANGKPYSGSYSAASKSSGSSASTGSSVSRGGFGPSGSSSS